MVASWLERLLIENLASGEPEQQVLPPGSAIEVSDGGQPRHAESGHTPDGGEESQVFFVPC